MPRLTAEQRLRRLLALVPWVVAADGPLVADVCARFGYAEAELVEDLDLLFLCGVHPYTPDALIEVDMADGRVWVRYADYFARPLRLTPAEGVALLAAGRTLLASPGADPSGPLGRGMSKLAAALGVDPGEALEVALGDAGQDVLEVLHQAVAEHHQLEIEYYAFGRDQWTWRVVDPYAVFSASGQWYLSAFCHSVDDERLFRVDRLRQASLLPTTFAPPTRTPDFRVFEPSPEDPRVVLELAPSGRWVAEQYPVEQVDQLGGGRTRVRLAVSATAWLERLLLRLGPAATVVDGDHDVAATAACRVLARYRGGDDLQT